MSPTLYLTRAKLRRDPAIAAIAALLMPAASSSRTQASHQLVWSLFAGDQNAKRDFLWREDQHGTFFILSASPPGESPVFETEAKPFAPALAKGDLLRFSLRANATRSIKTAGAKRGKRADVVMAALNALPQGERAQARPGLIIETGRNWLEAQGGRNGFALAEATALRVEGYETLQIPRVGAKPIQISLLDFEGVLTVTDPAIFLSAIKAGFGHAKAFGCGLMLMRRA